jgi:Transglutaminase elicitor
LKSLFLISLACLSLSAFAKIDEVWAPTSNPSIMTPNQERNFGAFPLKATINDGQKFWSGDYWALRDGNINLRWNNRNRRGWNYRSPSPQEAQQMSLEEISGLSATEKYDLWTGHYDYPLKAEVYELAANSRAEEWEGICHGWAPASMNHHEPTPKTVTSVDGLTIPFGSSDIKALLSYYYAYGFQVPNTYQTGSRCFGGGGLFGRRGECPRDLNAGAFHIIIGNKIGLQGTGFVADLDKSDEVWNHPIKGYESQVTDEDRPNRSSAYGTVRVIRVKTKLFYVSETENYWLPVLGTEHQVELTKKYEYDLDIGFGGEILGGKWKSGDRPDFIWLKEKPAAFEGHLARLGELLND